MNWWLDRGVDGFRMDVINFISKDPALPDGADRRRRVAPGRRRALHLRPAHPRVPAGDAPRGLRGARRAAQRRRDAGRHDRGGEARSPTRRATSSTWSSSSSTSTSTSAASSGTRSRSTCATSSARFGRWQEGLAETGWNSLYWNNHDQPRIVSRWGDDGEHRVRSAKLLGTLLHLHRGTPYVYQGEELGMTNVPFDSIEAFRDIESLNHYAEAVGGGEDPEAVLAVDAPDEPRQRAHADAVGRLAARGLHDRRAVDPRQPQPRRDQRARRPSPTPARSSTTTGG